MYQTIVILSSFSCIAPALAGRRLCNTLFHIHLPTCKCTLLKRTVANLNCEVSKNVKKLPNSQYNLFSYFCRLMIYQQGINLNFVE